MGFHHIRRASRRFPWRIGCWSPRLHLIPRRQSSSPLAPQAAAMCSPGRGEGRLGHAGQFGTAWFLESDRLAVWRRTDTSNGPSADRRDRRFHAGYRRCVGTRVRATRPVRLEEKVEIEELQEVRANWWRRHATRVAIGFCIFYWGTMIAFFFFLEFARR